MADQRYSDSSGADDERDDRVHLDVREHDGRPLAAESSQQRRRHVAQPSVMPAQQSRIERRAERERARELGIEKPVLMPGLHPPAVEAFPKALAQRKRVEAHPPVEPLVGAAKGPHGYALVWGPKVLGTRDAPVARSLAPGGLVLARVEEEELEPFAQASPQVRDDAGVEEEAGGERVREDEPDRIHDAVRAPSAKAMRSASEAPSRPWNRSASVGVPHAGQPSTPNTVTARPSRWRRRESPSAPMGAWSSTTKISVNGSTRSASQSESTRLSHGMFTTCTRAPIASAAFRASCSITGPYAKSSASEPSRRIVPRPGVPAMPFGRSSKRGDGPIARRNATLSAASSTAQRSSPRVSSALAAWTTVRFGNAASRDTSLML